VFFQAQRFVFGGSGTVCPTEKKWENIAALARVRVPCDSALLKEGKGLAGARGHWDKTFRAVPCAVHPICEKGVAWYLAGKKEVSRGSGAQSHAAVL